MAKGKKIPAKLAAAAKSPKSPKDEKTIEKASSKINSLNNNSKTKKSRKGRRKESFGIYIYKVLKELHPSLEITIKSVEIMDSFVNDIFERLSMEVSGLLKRTSRTRLLFYDIHTSIRLLVSGELGRHAEFVAIKAVTEYTSTSK